MPFVAILGAGPLGGALTYTLANRGRFDEVRLIDPVGTIAAGKALDVRQAGPPDGASTRVTGHAELGAASGAWVLVLADLLDIDGRPADLLATLRQVVATAPGALLICAGHADAPLLPKLVGGGVIAPDLVVGSAPGAVAAAARALVAAHCDLSAQDVAVSLEGDTDRPGGLSVDWNRSALCGRAANVTLTREQQARLDDLVAHAWPPGPLVLATTAARVAEAAWFGSRVVQHLWSVDRSLVDRAGQAQGTGAALTATRFAPGGRLRRVDVGDGR